ncbi:MAG TPA: alpha-amylase family glycosyl hydrolase, partial [Tenuifilaceae bacterium]|nr:alpha-amylase family glycosyl hydrolase [Tenuifilaceae bacterium]HPJ44646.1 alpha-amylase family glycosyl hydrolase [Tenuifilaceae bacterium]HPQ35507.1 alpha-amylase family glycosyl hydrolase [Tenuifilaceae bacterium]
MRILFCLILVFYLTKVLGQVTAYPTLPTASDEVVITFDATQGSGNLAGYTGDVYTHTGVIIEGSSAWQYVIGSWGNNSTQPKLTRIENDIYSLTISPSIREFYKVPDDKVIQKLCFVFRTSTSSLKTEDLFYEVYLEELNVVITSPNSNYPIYYLNEDILIEVDSKMATSLEVYVDDELIDSSEGDPISTSFTATEYGKHWIKAIADNETDEPVTDSVFFFIMGDVPVVSLPAEVDAGVNVTGTNEVTLVLNDPPALKEYVFAIGDFNEWEIAEEYLMNRTPDGTNYWLTIDGLDPNKEYIYQYWIDGKLKIADPYTSQTSDPWYDKYISDTNYPGLIPYPEGKTSGVASVFKIDEEEYSWQATNYVTPNKDNLVIYELHVRDFVDNDDIKSVRKKLDYLQTLGVSAIELMPINEFEGNDSWGYNPSFYFAPDKAYGTPNDYKQFIDECHSRGIAVIVDMVLNHSYGLSPFVQIYFDASAGQWGQPTSENPWYNEVCPHEPYCWGYDFNHQSEFTKNLIDKVTHFWLTEFRIDGFRFDFTKGFTNYQTANQGSNYDAARISILKRFADYIWSIKSDAYVILEHFAENSEEKELANYGMMLWGNLNYNYNEATMGWLSNSDFSWISYKKRGWNNPNLVGYMESHDEERLMYKNLTYGNSSNPEYDVKDLEVALERQKLAGMFFFTIPGPKMIWQFGELGYDYSINHCPDGTL